VILQRACHYFCRRGRELIYQNDDRVFFRSRVIGNKFARLEDLRTASHRQYLLASIQKQVRHAMRLVNQPTMVAAKIEDQRRHAALPQISESCVDFIESRSIETAFEIDVANSAAEEKIIRD
jgi:hypothetical protein